MAKNIIFEIPEPHIAQQETKGLRVFVKVSEKKENSKLLTRCGQTIQLVFELDFEMACFDQREIGSNFIDINLIHI